MKPTSAMVHRLRQAVQRQRLVETVTRLVAVPSPTGEAGAAADCLAQMLATEGFAVERPEGGHASAPAVAVHLDSRRPGRTLQFDGHLDVVHLPFVAPAVQGDVITGSGACDMKAGVAAAVEALRVLRDTNALTAGSVLLTAHDLHEAPWGFGEQLDRLIAEGYVGDGVLLPEPLSDRLPLIGRGAATWKVTIRRPGPPVHEVARPAHEPSVISAGATVVQQLDKFDSLLGRRVDPVAGRETVFIGQIHIGEIYNQYPQEGWLEGTRRWLPGASRKAVEEEFRAILEKVAGGTGTTMTAAFSFIRDPFRLEPSDPLVDAFQQSYETLQGQRLPTGPKSFVDDGNCFCGRAEVPAITHGPRSGGQHTVQEWVSIDDLVRVAQLYALTAVAYCGD
jgi:acetylornithine deacetylase/succinyl-diaminopimelate desuccinylase-like protein